MAGVMPAASKRPSNRFTSKSFEGAAEKVIAERKALLKKLSKD